MGGMQSTSDYRSTTASSKDVINYIVDTLQCWNHRVQNKRTPAYKVHRGLHALQQEARNAWKDD